MKRTILFILILIGTGLFSVLFLYDWTRIAADFGDFLQAIFGRMSSETDVAGIGLSGLLLASLSFAICYSIRPWQPVLLASITSWPLKNRPVASFFIKIALVTLGGMITLSLIGGLRDTPQGVVMLVFFCIFVGIILYDFRGLIVGGTPPEPIPDETNNAGWELPDSIDSALLGKPELRLELARDLRRRAI